jgi:uncharacterized membrane protein
MLVCSAQGMAHERRSSNEQLAITLGWFSVGLGMAQLIAPGAVAQAVGLPQNSSSKRVLQAMGLRELATGLTVLARPGAPAPLWARVAGDALDLSILGKAAADPEAQRARLALATAAVLGMSALDALSARRASRAETRYQRRPIEAAAAVTIGRPIDEVYEFWEDIEIFPRLMRNLESVVDLGGGRSHWRVAGPAGIPVEWDAEIVADLENRQISWRSLPGSGIDNRGSVRFAHAPGTRGTEVHVQIRYWPPAGELGHAAAWLFGRTPRQQLREGLRRIKQLLEVGEISMSDGPGLARPARPTSPDALNRLVGVEQ